MAESTTNILELSFDEINEMRKVSDIPINTFLIFLKIDLMTPFS